jgi:hypothetical protein
MNNELERMRKEVIHDLIQITVLIFFFRWTWEKCQKELKIVDVIAEIRTRHFPNKRQKRYRVN